MGSCRSIQGQAGRVTSLTQIDPATEDLRPSPRRQLSPGDRIVVCGGGPAGLTAAHVLARKGYAVRVIEADDVLGGISRTARYKGYRFDIGGHRFFTKIPSVEQFWEDILGDQLIDVPRLSRILYKGKYFRYPLKAVNAILGLGPLEAGRIIVSYVQARMRPHPLEENFEQWVSNRFGSRLYRIFFKTYTEKVWGIPCTEIRAEWAAQRIQGLSLARAIISATTLNKRSASIKTLISKFRYPRLGPGQMWESCADRIVEMGGIVSLGTRVRRFTRGKNSVRSIEVESASGTEVIDAEHFISTIPLANLACSLGEETPPEVIEAAKGLTYRDFILVALILDRDKLFPDNWIYVHTPAYSLAEFRTSTTGVPTWFRPRA
jgi:Protoporphyrinogen oxidase